MGVRTKTLVIVLLVGVVFGVFAVTTSNPNLFKGQIFDEPGNTTEESDQPLARALPDLSVDLKLIYPEGESQDLIAEVTLQNIGDGEITGGAQFEYEVFLISGDTETSVFTNSDSYSALAPGDAFSFSYPIPRTIYQYSEKGAVKVVADINNSIKESNEENNEIILDYNF